jgi:O-antigen/teichoic acid export membrane protein
LFSGARQQTVEADGSDAPGAQSAGTGGNSSTTKVVGSAALWSVGNAFIGQALSMLAFMITARFISPEAFGIVAIATLSVELVKRILVEPLATRLLAMNSPNERDYEDCFSQIITLSVFGSLLLVVLAKPVASLVNLPGLPVVLYVMSSMMLGIGVARTHEVWYAKRYEFRLLAIRSGVATLLAGTTGVIMALTGFGMWSLVAQQVVGTVASFILLFLFSDWRPALRLPVRESFRNLAQVKHFMVTSVVAFAGAQVDVFFVTSWLGPAAGGLYSAAKRLILAANLIVINSLQSLILASFAERSRSPRAYQIHLDSLEIFALIITPLFVGLAILSEDAIAFLLSPKWLASSPMLAALSYASLAGGLASVVTSYLMASGANWSRTAVIVGTATVVVATLPFIAPFGSVAVAWFMAATAWLSMFTMNTVAARRSKVSVVQPLQALLLPFAGAAAMLGVSYLAGPYVAHSLRLLVLPPLLLFAYLYVVGLIGFATKARVAVHVRNFLRNRAGDAGS